VEETCLRWLDPEEKMRCAEFAPSTRCEGKTTTSTTVSDAYEYPNEAGAKPEIMKNLVPRPGTACSAEGKRLCGDSEWTLACEGQERMPYPLRLTPATPMPANIRQAPPDVDEGRHRQPRATRAAEVERLWQGEPSGFARILRQPVRRARHDRQRGRVGRERGGTPYKSGLKGGLLGPVRDRCRP